MENARIYTLPDEPPPILVSGFGPKAVRLAAEIGDGYVNVGPDAELLELFRSSGGGDKPVHSAFKARYGDDGAECVRRRPTAFGPTRRCPRNLRKYCRRRGTSSRPAGS